VAVSNIHCDTYLSHMNIYYIAAGPYVSFSFHVIGLREWCWSCTCSSLTCLLSVVENETLR